MKSIALLLHQATALLKREFEKSARPYSLTLMQWRVLAELGANGALKQVALGAALNSSPMTISDVVERLDEAGLVSRAPDPVDSRAKRVALTEEGHRLVQRMRAVSSEVFAKALAGIPADDIETLTRSLDRICDNLADS